ncbi:MAG: hypothetical protein ACI97A_002241 [Planctomycetota bacterium]|jgi:hypothetical protein
MPTGPPPRKYISIVHENTYDHCKIADVAVFLADSEFGWRIAVNLTGSPMHIWGGGQSFGLQLQIPGPLINGVPKRHQAAATLVKTELFELPIECSFGNSEGLGDLGAIPLKALQIMTDHVVLDAR